MNISEVARKTGLSSKTIRFYEQQELIRAAGRAENGYRIYTPAHVMQLSIIKRARDLGFSLQESKELLDLVENSNRRSAEVKQKVLSKIESLEAQIRSLGNSRNLLLEVARRCPGDENADCPILDVLQDCEERTTDCSSQ